MTTLTGEFRWPGISMVNVAAGSPNFGTLTTIDAAGEYIAFMLRATEDMVISHIATRLGTAAGSPVCLLSIETVHPTTGEPNGLWATNTSITTGTITSNTTAIYALTAPATIPRSSVFAVKIAYTSGTSVIIPLAQQFSMTRGIPYKVINVGTPTRTGLSNAPMLQLGSSATTWYQLPGFFAATASASNGLTNSVAGNERGLRVKFPWSGRIVAMTCTPGSGGVNDFDYLVRDDAGAELSSSRTSFLGPQSGLSSATMYLPFDNPVNVVADTWYRITMIPTSVNSVSFPSLTLLDASLKTGIPGGVNQHMTTYTTAGGWVNSDLDIVYMDVIFDRIEVASGVPMSRVFGGM